MVFDLFSYIANTVPRIANQHPVFKADAVESNFAIARRPVNKSVSRVVESRPLPETEQIEALLVALYPLGPTQDQIWQRAGGDLSRLSLGGHGAAQWHAR